MLTLRPGELADAAAAVQLLRRSIAQLCQPDHAFDTGKLKQWLDNKTENSWARWVNKPELIVLVACLEGALVGVSAMSVFGFVQLNYVAPEARFQGVSKAMLLALEDRARALGLDKCSLNSTVTAERFYRERGYVPASDGQYGALKLEKRLAP